MTLPVSRSTLFRNPRKTECGAGKFLVRSMVRATPFALYRVVAILLLLVAGAELYACEIADACVTAAPGQNSDCDQPLGDNCLCCCHHIVPVTIVTLEAAEYVCDGAPPEPLVYTTSRALPIEHPPQL